MRCPKPHRVVLLAFVLALSAACTSPPTAPSGSKSAPSTTDEPALARGVAAKRPTRAPPPARPAPPRKPPPDLHRPWAYVMPVDHGVRSDDGGKGGFLAPRFHGRHNGLDMLAPLGTPVLSPCDGEARSGTSGSFGRWVQVVCPVPEELSAGNSLHASIFYSHLSKVSAKKLEFERVRRGVSVGAVGKSGNASGSDIAPHLHLEIIVHDDAEAARNETHSGRNQGDSPGAGKFADELRKKCLEPNGFASKSADLTRARRLDPFVVLTCLAPEKPALSAPRAPLDAVSERWSSHYAAKSFDVDVGRRQ
jgi:murein DD-endopeptidase MepM/ murein hydrolase activator NlpD